MSSSKTGPGSYPQRGLVLPPEATEVLLVRHGASAAAVPSESFELLEGQGDPPLAPEGVEQARAVGRRLAEPPAPEAIFVTPLRRTGQTAEPLAAATGLEPQVVPELREVHLGEWEGGELRIRAAHGDPLLARVLSEERWDAIPGAESMEAFAERVRAGIERVVAATGPGRAAAFVHGGVIGEACHQATGSRRFAFVYADNGSITRLAVMPDGRWLLRGFNDIAHVADTAR